jgi:PAS domain S-box-containing protein
MLSQLFDNVPDALVVVDDTGRILLANRQAENLFGYPPQGLTGLDVEALMPEGVRERHRTHRISYMDVPRIRPMGSSGMTLVGQRSDGTQFPVEIALSPLDSPQGSRYLASIRDISETLRARQALVRARYDAVVARIGQQALEASDTDHLIAGLPALVAAALDIEAVAVAFVHEGNQIEIRAATGLDDSSRITGVDAKTWQLLTGGQPSIVDVVDFPFPLVNKSVGSGAIIPLPDHNHSMGALLGWSSQPRRFDHDAVHLLQSVANMLAALIQRRRSEERLAHAQRLEAIGQLTGGIAHDFNNLLTVVSGSLQLLQIQSAQQPEAAELTASALRSVWRGAELTGKLLAFARRQRLSPAGIEPRRQLLDLELLLRRTLGESVQLRIDCPEDISPVYADPAQLDAALLNLALNARDAMPRGGEIAITVTERWDESETTQPGHYVVFSIADTGAGMTPETLARAVEPFFTTKGPGRGSGLGLSMVYGFVEQSGGHLQIQSRLGYGTRVEVLLPAAHGGARATESVTAGASPGSGEAILVVEDEAAVGAIATALLSSLGYRVHAASSAAEALVLLDQHPAIGLLFSDVMLGPGMTGKELANAVRQRRPDIAVLLTSGYEETVPPAGTEKYELLRKPYRREELALAIRRNLDRTPRASA